MEYIAGFFAGGVGVLVSHPFDTVKTVYQMDGLADKKYKGVASCARGIYLYGGGLAFYKGVRPPLVGVGLEKCIVFGSYNAIQKYTDNIFVSGVFAGLCCTCIVTPIEKIKILQQQQVANSDCRSVFKATSIRNLYRGWTATLGREVPGFGIYFSTYEYLKDRQKNTIFAKSYLMPFLNGSLSGAASWLFIYPSDPIKTLMQTKNIPLVNAVACIYKQYGLSGFYRGFGLGLFRAVPLHGGVFMGYEFFKSSYRYITEKGFQKGSQKGSNDQSPVPEF